MNMNIDIKVNINKKLIDYAVKDYEYMMHHKKQRDTSVEEAFSTNSNNSNKYKKLLRSLLGIIIFIGKTGLPEIKFRYDKNNSNMDNRIIAYKNGYYEWFNHAIKNNHSIKPGVFYVYVTDVYYYENDHVPFGIMAKPENRGGILIPENTLFSNIVEDKDYNHEQLAELFGEKCNIPYDNRKELAFFKGANTGADKWNIRKYIEDAVSNSNMFNVKLTGKKIPNYDYCKYAVLLNLPGHQPWSYRFREVLLSCSLAVDIAVHVSYDGGKTWNKPWIHFWSCLFEHNVHYIKIDTKFIENNNEFNTKEKEKLLNNLNKLMDDFSQNKKHYKSIATNGCKLMRSIKMKHIYQYMTDVWNMIQ